VRGVHGTVFLRTIRLYNFVVLNLGGAQWRGTELRNARFCETGRLIGKIRISSVEPATAIGDIISNSLARGVQVQPGDSCNLCWHKSLSSEQSWFPFCYAHSWFAPYFMRITEGKQHWSAIPDDHGGSAMPWNKAGNHGKKGGQFPGHDRPPLDPGFGSGPTNCRAAVFCPGVSLGRTPFSNRFHFRALSNRDPVNRTFRV